MDDDFVKKRLERDLAELKRMCDDHFQKRAADEENIQSLEGRMNDRKAVGLIFIRSETHRLQFKTREEQKNARVEKEKAKAEAERAAKEAREKAEEDRKANEVEEKAAILSGNYFLLTNINLF